MSRTKHHNASGKSVLRIKLAGKYNGYSFEGWGANYRKFCKHMVHKQHRRAANDNLKTEIVEALHERQPSYTPIPLNNESELLAYENELDATRYADKCGDPYCSYCGELYDCDDEMLDQLSIDRGDWDNRDYDNTQDEIDRMYMIEEIYYRPGE